MFSGDTKWEHGGKNGVNLLILYPLKTSFFMFSGNIKWEHGGRNELNDTPFL